MAAAWLFWMGLVLASPAPAGAEPGAARVTLGAGDDTGLRMFGRSLHRRRILRGEARPTDDGRLDLPRWLAEHGAVLDGAAPAAGAQPLRGSASPSASTPSRSGAMPSSSR